MSVVAERRKKELTLSSLCRFCLTSENCASIYDRTKTQKGIALPLQIMSCLSVEVFPSDGMPTQICTKCKFFMELFFIFKTHCRNGDEAILQHLKDGSPLDPIPWPAKLVKIFKNENRQKKQEVKTIVAEDGAMMQVMASNDNFESDDNEENVYNYKVEGDFKVTKDAACIKVLKTGETLQINKQDVKQGKEARDRPFNCKPCNKTFLRLHHLQRHRRTKHETRRHSGTGSPDFSCELCPEIFMSQDELIYHSAQHATEDLTCPLCQEKFDNVEDVSEHIKGHVDGDELMCDMCELMFTNQEKLDAHIANKHPEEMGIEEDSEENSMETEDDDNINVKEEHDHMVVEIKKPTNFNKQESKLDGNSEGEIDLYGDSSMPDINSLPVLQNMSPPKPPQNKNIQQSQNSQTAAILRKAEEIKKKAQQATEAKKNEKQEEKTNSENKGTKGIGDKALRLLEQELQDLKRTNVRNESQKPAAKFTKQAPKQNKRTAATIIPAKNKPVEEKKPTPVQKVISVEKKPTLDKTVTKENKEPKDSKEKTTTTVVKQDKSSNQVNKGATKNGSTEDTPEDNPTRRSNRGSKVKEYAQMIKERSHVSSDSDDVGDEDYKQSQDGRRKRSSVSKQAPKEVPTPTAVQEETPTTRKRGRPKKEIKAAVPPKVSKPNSQEDNDGNNTQDGVNTSNPVTDTPAEQPTLSDSLNTNSKQSPTKDGEPKPAPVMLSPSGQTLKAVPITSLPPGVKPLPLPVSLRPEQDTCNMQIGEKMVKVKKIVMTKAEVQEMAKKGLLEVKGGTVVLKPGIKLPKTDVEAGKESQTTPTKAKPTRCEIDEE